MIIDAQWGGLVSAAKTFLDTEIIGKNYTISTQVFTKLTKFPVHWSSKIPTNYKRNAITS